MANKKSKLKCIVTIQEGWAYILTECCGNVLLCDCKGILIVEVRLLFICNPNL